MHKKKTDRRQLRIGIFVNGSTTRISGGEFHAIRVGEIWANDHDVSFISPRAGAYWLAGLLNKIKLHCYETPLEPKALKGVSNSFDVAMLYLVRTIICSLYRNAYDVLLASSHYPQDVIPAVIQHLRNRKAPLIVYCHGLSVPREKGLASYGLSLIYNYLGLLLSRPFASSIFVVNNRTSSILLSIGYSRSKVVLTSNGVESLSKPRPNKIFDGVFLGRLTPEKGVLDIIDVWKKVCVSRPKSLLLIVGSGPLLAAIQKRVDSFGLGANVCIREWAWGNKKYEFILSSRVFVYPSYLESWGLAVAEAIACRIPVVAFDLPAYHETFKGVSGSSLITVPIGNKELMAAQILRLLDNPIAERMLRRDGELLLQKYDWSTVANREINAVESALTGR